MFVRKQDDKIWLSPAAVVRSLNRFLIPCNSLGLTLFKNKPHKSGAQEKITNWNQSRQKRVEFMIRVTWIHRIFLLLRWSGTLKNFKSEAKFVSFTVHCAI